MRLLITLQCTALYTVFYNVMNFLIFGYVTILVLTYHLPDTQQPICFSCWGVVKHLFIHSCRISVLVQNTPGPAQWSQRITIHKERGWGWWGVFIVIFKFMTLLQHKQFLMDRSYIKNYYGEVLMLQNNKIIRRNKVFILNYVIILE